MVAYDANTRVWVIKKSTILPNIYLAIELSVLWKINKLSFKKEWSLICQRYRQIMTT